MLPESALEILFFIVMLILGYQAILDITTTYKLRDRLSELEKRVEELEKNVYLYSN